MNRTFPTLDDIRQAAGRIEPYAHRTPVMTCAGLNTMAGSELYFKCENFQKAGAFKFRGACNAVFSLSREEAARGVATHSSGNHAQAVALAARLRDIPAYVVMPSDSPAVKRAAVEEYGADITFCEPTLADRERTLDRVVAETGAVFIHPYNDERVIAGQGTAALEFLEDQANCDVLIAPVGGGGLLSGTLLTVKTRFPEIKVFGAEPAGADDAYRSLRAGRIIPAEHPSTIADGLRTSLGDLTFPIIQSYVDDILTVSESAIIAAMRAIWERMKIIVEPSAAVSLGVLLEHQRFQGLRIGVILSGGNADLDHLPWHT
ncbi:MAG TPA: pyridoxal-phosphate dependent enzyme [bacterium]|nr:pyridoxal-phosphate dependent enzyme [bacterium]